MTDNDFMRFAVAEARNSAAAGGLPMGAVMVQENKIIAKGWPMVGSTLDPTAHGEINCIKAAVKTLNSLDLTGCTLYSTLEPCSLCLSCASWSSVSRIVFGAYKEDIGKNPYEIKDYHAEEWGKKLAPMNGKTVEVKGGILRKECAALMKNIKNWSPLLTA